MEENKILEKTTSKCVFWKTAAMFLLGMIVGFLLAPIKSGVSIGNNNNIVDCGDDDDDESNEEDE